ncbi:MAG: hypothetical protein FVQ78_10830 [Solirubrobacterales bacterium]|nr:hypothetical protein [Solirubrobacterales bacterium]
MSEADDFFAIARKEYAVGKKKKLDKSIRQGAEKAWNASVQATKALAIKIKGKIPRSYNAQRQFLYELRKHNQNKINGYLLTAFKGFASRLHGECFYHGEYDFQDLEQDFEEVKHYIDEIKKMEDAISDNLGKKISMANEPETRYKKTKNITKLFMSWYYIIKNKGK